jgi:hypothetical protein
MNTRQRAALEHKRHILAEVEIQRSHLRRSLHELRHPFAGRNIRQMVLHDVLSTGLSMRPIIAVAATVGGLFLVRHVMQRWSRSIGLIRLAFQVWSIGRSAMRLIR